MIQQKIDVDLEIYSWGARVANIDGAFANNNLIVFGDTRPRDFPGVPSSFSVRCIARPDVPDISEDRLRELGVDRHQVCGVLSVHFSTWNPNPSLQATLYADASIIEQFNKHAEYALLRNVGELSVSIELRAREFPKPELGGRYIGFFAITDYSFHYSKKFEGDKQRVESMKRQALRIYEKAKDRDTSCEDGDEL